MSFTVDGIKCEAIFKVVGCKRLDTGETLHCSDCASSSCSMDGEEIREEDVF